MEDLGHNWKSEKDIAVSNADGRLHCFLCAGRDRQERWHNGAMQDYRG